MFWRIFNLEEFFQDHRSSCYLLIDVNKYKIIEDLENHIKLLFSINEYIYLSENDVWLPGFEDIILLKLSSDIIRVKRLQAAYPHAVSTIPNENDIKHEPNRDIVEVVEDEVNQATGDNRKEKKRKKRHESSIPSTSTQNSETGSVDTIDDSSRTTKKKKKAKKEKRWETDMSIDGNNSDVKTENILSTAAVSSNCECENNVPDNISFIERTLVAITPSILGLNRNTLQCVKVDSERIETDRVDDVNNVGSQINRNGSITPHLKIRICSNAQDFTVKGNLSDQEPDAHTSPKSDFNGGEELAEGIAGNCDSTQTRRRHRVRHRHRRRKDKNEDTTQQEMNNIRPKISASEYEANNKRHEITLNHCNVNGINNKSHHIRFELSDAEDCGASYDPKCNADHKTGDNTVIDASPAKLSTKRESITDMLSAASNDEPSGVKDYELTSSTSRCFTEPVNNTIKSEELISNNNDQTPSGSCKDKTEKDLGDNSSPAWFTELMKVKRMSQFGKPPVFCRHSNPIDNRTIQHSIENSRENSLACFSKVKNDVIEPSDANHTLLVDDIVDFKILFLSQDYTPTISDSVIGRVIKVSDTLVKLKILYGKEVCKPLNGKFSLPSEDDANEGAKEGEDEDVVELLIKDLINPRKVINPFEMFNKASTVASKSERLLK